MATFIVIPDSADGIQRLPPLMTRFGTQAFRLPRGEWLVKFDGTSRQLSDTIGITSSDPATPPVGLSAVVLAFGGYWGNAQKSIWEWIDLNQK